MAEMAFPDGAYTASDLGLAPHEEEALGVLDLPQLYTKPPGTTLLSILADISSEPPSWEATPRNGTPGTGTPGSLLSGTSTPFKPKRKVKSEGLPSYLTSIISSPLAWIEDDEEKDRIWEATSQRLSERAGRSARGAISRTFVVQDSDANAVELTLHEPALTADNLGLKTWASSYLLAKRLTLLRHTLPALRDGELVLELGAGTGLVGLAAAAVLQTLVVLTDLPEIVPNLERNAQANATTIALHGGKVDVAVLDWSKPASFEIGDGEDAGLCTFPIILAADPIYSPEHPRLLANAIDCHLARAKEARVVVEMPLRDAYGDEREDFRQRMADIGLDMVEDGEEVGFDDWATAGDDEGLAEVRCWWSIWSWK